MRILLIGNYALDGQHSMLRFANMLDRHMTDRGHSVTVIRPTALLGKMSARPVFRKWLGYIDKYVIFPFMLHRISRNYDLVHICDHSNAVYRAYLRTTPCSITCHDVIAINTALDLLPEQRPTLMGRFLQRRILSNLITIENVVCVSQATAIGLASLAPCLSTHIRVIHNALSDDCLPPSDDKRRQTLHSLGIDDDEAYIMHVGGNAWYKNRGGVLRIFRALLTYAGTRRRQLRLVLVGEPLTEELTAFISSELPADTVIELTRCDDKTLWALYSGATALLFPSLDEGFGWPIIEAQACGCPVITNQRAPMDEVAGNGAIYVDPNDDASAAGAIASRFDELSRIAAMGRENVVRFRPEDIYKEYEAFWLAVLDRERVTQRPVEDGDD